MRPATARALAVLALAAGLGAAWPAPGQHPAEGGVEIVMCGLYDQCKGSVEVRGLPAATLEALAAREPSREEWSRVLALHVFTFAPADEVPPVLGDHEIAGGVLRFTPRFPFDGAVTYSAHLDGAALDRLAGLAAGTTPSLGGLVSLPAAFALSNAVTAVHPSGDRVPANLLRFYVHFRFPVFAKAVQHHVELLDEKGEEVPLAFVEVEGGLWDPEQKRLTLLLHPGRVKRGVAPGEQMGGPPLEEGRRYTLRIGKELRDGYGNPMMEDFTHGFEVTAADRRPPDPRTWQVSPPEAAGEPLEVAFEAPVDHALAQRLIAVVDAQGRPLAGRVELQKGDTRWLFHPEEPWRPGEHTLAVHPNLEDPAGNRPGRPFDRDLEAVREEASVLEIPFTIRDYDTP